MEYFYIPSKSGFTVSKKKKIYIWIRKQKDTDIQYEKLMCFIYSHSIHLKGVEESVSREKGPYLDIYKIHKKVFKVYVYIWV